MSRGFVKEGDQEEPVVIPPRAALPPGATNYVTPNGLSQLQEEKDSLLAQLKAMDGSDERELRRKRTMINGKLQGVSERLASARVLRPEEQPQDEVRFGATVAYRVAPNAQSVTITIVGVDEADVQQRKIAFVAPLAKALTGAKVGDTVKFKLGDETRDLEVLDISYAKS
ncbi:MAG: transcription elongation factor GreA [Flavobacteriaceae bacterium]|nr:transcription elongation factor GreA [Flavobacteriaceae bacterium]